MGSIPLCCSDMNSVIEEEGVWLLLSGGESGVEVDSLS
jgi:hypothetical protein